MNEYTEPHFRDYYIGGRSEYDPDYTDDMEAMRTWNAYIARVRRDAAREALDELIEDTEIDVRLGVEGGDNMRVQKAEAVIDAATIYRDTEYPEETP